MKFYTISYCVAFLVAIYLIRDCDYRVRWAAIAIAVQSFLYIYGNKLTDYNIIWPMVVFTLSGLTFLYLGATRTTGVSIGILAFVNVLIFGAAYYGFVKYDTGQGISVNAWNFAMMVLYGQLIILGSSRYEPVGFNY